LAADLLNEFEFETDKLILIPSNGGRFEVEVNGTVVYSKLQAGRHARAGEIVESVRKYQKESTT
jgi:selenoprotein W-related protein